MAAGTIYFFKIGQTRAINSSFAVIRCKLNGHHREVPAIFRSFFYKNHYPSPHSRAVSPMKISHLIDFRKIWYRLLPIYTQRKSVFILQNIIIFDVPLGFPTIKKNSITFISA